MKAASTEHPSEKWCPKAICTAHAIIQFYRELSTMLESGIPLTQALEVIGRYSSDPVMALVAHDLQRRVNHGNALSHALSSFPRIFSPVAVAMLRMGEASGRLTEQLLLLSSWSERDDRMRRQLKSALTYPVFCLSLMALLTLLLFTTVVPGFADIFRELGAELPLPTRILMLITKAVTTPACWAAAALVVWLGGLQARRILSTPGGKQMAYRAMLKLPMFGNLLRFVAIARFCAASETMLNSGQNLLISMRLAVEASGSPVLEADAVHLTHTLKNGHTLGEHFAARPELYPPALAHMIHAGEESSSTVAMFGLVARHFDEEIQLQIALIGAMLEPVLMGVVAVMVGSILVSIFLPLYAVLGKLGG